MKFDCVILLPFLVLISFVSIHAQQNYDVTARDNILAIMHKVNNYQKSVSGINAGRNWKTGTWYTGVMAFYKATGDTSLLNQAFLWSEENDWQIGSEWIYPANRLTCVQTYFEIYRIRKDPAMIEDAIEYMNSLIERTEPAYLSGWDYVDALYVGTPAFAMLGEMTGQNKYFDYLNRVFWEVADQLYDRDEGLYYRDSEARYIEKSRNGKKVLWSRGNGWAIASLPRILEYLPKDNPDYNRYIDMLKTMAASLARCQGSDGLWRSNLADPDEFPMPESSGTSFFTYAMAWGINNDILESEKYTPVVQKSWNGLCKIVNERGKVCWGQSVARGPGKISESDSGEYVTGAFLLAGSEMLKLAKK